MAGATNHSHWYDLTYSNITRSIGQSTAICAVIRARATNPIAPIVPCHRLVPTGGLGGDRWELPASKHDWSLEQRYSQHSIRNLKHEFPRQCRKRHDARHDL